MRDLDSGVIEFGNYESGSDDDLFLPDSSSSESESEVQKEDTVSSEDYNFLSSSSDSDPDMDPADYEAFSFTGVESQLHGDGEAGQGNEEETVEPLSTFKLCGDNIDKTVKRRYLRSDKGNLSLHYFHSYAVLDRIDVSCLSESPLPTCLNSPDKIAESLLPSLSDDSSMKTDFAILVSRVLAKHLEFFSFGFQDVVQWHISHKFSMQMAKKSTVVSNTSII